MLWVIVCTELRHQPGKFLNCQIQTCIGDDQIKIHFHMHWGISHYNEVIMDPMASPITSLALVYSTVYSGTGQSSASLAFVRGIHRWPVNSQHRGPVTRKMFPCDDVIMLGYFVQASLCHATFELILTANCQCLWAKNKETSSFRMALWPSARKIHSSTADSTHRRPVMRFHDMTSSCLVRRGKFPSQSSSC